MTTKWFDANGTDVDAYPDRAFQGGVYDRQIRIIETIRENATRENKSLAEKLDDDYLEEYHKCKGCDKTLHEEHIKVCHSCQNTFCYGCYMIHLKEQH